MKKLCLLLSLMLVFVMANSQIVDTTRTDTTAASGNTPTPLAGQNNSANGAAANETASSATAFEDSARRAADSLSFMNSFEYQKTHPAILYNNAPWVRMPIAGIVGFIIIWAIGLYLFYTTNLCRDLSYDPVTNQLRPVKDRPFSYSRVQLFWWTLIILSCYVSFFLYAPFDETILALNPTAVILLGGGLATSIFGRVMDNNQMARDNDNSDQNVPVRHQDLQTTQGLFLDLLSDEGGVTIHRFQAVIFNIVFGLAFIKMFFTAIPGAYPFPDFETWQLTLLGISAAGYLGLKANENGVETLEKRQVEAVKKNDPNPNGGGGNAGGGNGGNGGNGGDGGNEAIILPNAINEDVAPAPITAFQKMKAQLNQKGLIKP